jgi:osmotically-inducible protein OsmY
MRITPRNLLVTIGSAVTAVWLAGCVPLVVGTAAVGGASIAHDRRTAGTIVEDQVIEAKVLSALHKDTALWEQSHLSVTSYNMVVLLAGETPTEALRARAEEIAKGIKPVRRVYNELTIAAPSSLMTRSGDSWITTEVKAHFFKIKGVEDFDPTRVKVVTVNGTVYLMGLVSREGGNAAAESARQVGGVQRVVKLFEYGS